MNTTPTDARIALVVGRKGSGKSTVVRRALATWPRWVVWDLRGEYAQIPGSRLWSDVREFAAHLRAGREIAREVFACPAHQFDAWCRWAFDTGSMVVVIEELGRYVTAGWAPAPLQDLFDRNRHAGIWLLAVASRLATIPKGLVHQADDVACARMELPSDLRFLAEWKGPMVSQAVRELPDHRFLRIRT